MNITIVTPTLEGGVGTVCKNQVDALKNNQCELFFLSSSSENNIKSNYKKFNFYSILFLSLFLKIALRKNTSNKYVIVSHVVQMNFLMVVLKIFLKFIFFKKVKLLCYEHIHIGAQSYYEKFNNILKIKLKFFRISYFFADKIVFVSHESKDCFIEEYPFLKQKCIVIYNPVMTTSFISEEKKNKPRMFFVGRKSHQKGLDFLEDIVKQLDKKLTEVIELHIIGLNRQDLNQEIFSSKYIKIIAHGFLANPYQNVAESDILLLTSRYEGLPTVIIEALIRKMTVLAFKCPSGVIEALDDGKFGCLVESENTVMFTMILLQLLSGELKHNFQEDLKSHLDKFSFQSFYEEFEKNVQN